MSGGLGGNFSLKMISNVLKGTLPMCSILRNNSGLSGVSLFDTMKRFDPKVEPPTLDFEYLCDDQHVNSIRKNILARKGKGDIDLVLSLYKQFLANKGDKDIEKQLIEAASNLPNRTHPEVLEYGSESKVMNSVGTKPVYKFGAKSFLDLTSPHNIFLSGKSITNLAGPRSYFLSGNLALLEAALVKYTLSYLLSKGFKFISVPDILKKNVLESCGMVTDGDRHQIYFLDEGLYGKDWCLSGTSEMAIGNYLRGKNFTSSELPLNFAAVSRCFRAEISMLAEEKGLYRVHQFTKVEMFSVCSPEMSAEILESFRSHQELLFANLGLHYQTLDMAAHELGAQAYRKYDIEAWMPGHEKYGEISSCSDCTDFQTRRLHIKCDDQFAHTVNGTACAIPRLLLALVETHQTEDGNVNIPSVLQKYTGFDKLIGDLEEQEKYKLSKVLTHNYQYWDHSKPLNPKVKKKSKNKFTSPSKS